jgi:protein phosphatase
MVIEIPDPSVVLLIGPSGSGKSTFARRHFRATEVLSSDFCRALVCDDENNQTVTDDAFELLHLILAKRLQRGRTTLIDATNVQISAREPIIAAAKKYSVAVVAIVFLLPEETCQVRNRQRAYRQVPSEVIQQQMATLAASEGHLESEGFDAVTRISSLRQADSLALTRIRKQH